MEPVVVVLAAVVAVMTSLSFAAWVSEHLKRATRRKEQT